ncbi:Hypothetical predicted protein [Marmota monax]|uniref:Uncharacterized protein n=1 Tax=Marmota monax TaxID=9995 RepID=A0A5E4AD64_MARMO|nr:Hypothetical predicted protein [Marmota monax]
MSPSTTPAGAVEVGRRVRARPGPGRLGGGGSRTAGQGPGARRGGEGRGPAAARRPAGSSREPAWRADPEPEPQPERGGGGRSQSGRRLCRRSRGAATLAPRPPALTLSHTRALEAGGPGPTGPPWTPPVRGAETPALLPSPVQRATPRDLWTGQDSEATPPAPSPGSPINPAYPPAILPAIPWPLPPPTPLGVQGMV